MRILSLVLAVTFSLSAHAESRAQAHSKSMEASRSLHQFMAREDQAIPISLLKHAECVTVITKMIRAGFIVGGRSGWGVTSCRTSHGWSPAAFHRLNGLSWGFLAGLEKIDVVLVYTKPGAIDSLSRSKLRLGADISATVGPVGRGLEAGTDFKLDSPVYSYSRGKGLYAGASVNGSVLSTLDGYNHSVYGARVSTRDILSDNNLNRINTTQSFVDALNTYAP